MRLLVDLRATLETAHQRARGDHEKARAQLQAAADKLRANMDAAEYKHVVLGLIFLKYISDAFQERHDTLKKDICNLAGIIPDCLNVLLVELRPVSTSTWQPLSSGPTCVDRAAPIQPVTEFNAGASDEMMLIRACAKFDPLFPTAGLGFSLPKDNTGAYALIAATAFVNEPAPGS